MQRLRLRHLILLAALVNAFLYSALLPLWEGFDEAFHYAYVETLWQTHALPVLGRTLVPQDVSRSFEFAPVSHIVHRGIAQSTSFDDWYALPIGERERRRSALEGLRPAPPPGETGGLNYEAHHPPLAYLPMAVVDGLLASEPITVRVLILRLIVSLLSVVMVFIGALSLLVTLHLSDRWINSGLFIIFCSQMLYATVSHVANDWLAIGIGALLFSAVAAFVSNPDSRNMLRTAVLLAAGLLTKAYFLPLAIWVFGMAVWRRASQRTLLMGVAVVTVLAGPWYLRNVILFGNIPGTYEEFSGVGFGKSLAVVRQIDWPSTAGFLARAAIWTGNSSLNTFSRVILNAMLALIAVSLVSLALRWRAIRAAERAIATGVVLFSLALGYASAAAFAQTRGASAGASPWYAEILLVPVTALVCLGLARWRWGWLVGVLNILLWGWVLLATWPLKLFPMYSGGGRQKGVVSGQVLSATALAPTNVLVAGWVVSTLLTVSICLVLCRQLAAHAES